MYAFVNPLLATLTKFLKLIKYRSQKPNVSYSVGEHHVFDKGQNLEI